MEYVILYSIQEISMRKRVSQIEKDIVEQKLTRIFESKWIRDKAKESGLIERERKIDPVIMY